MTPSRGGGREEREESGRAGTSFVITLWLEPTEEASRPEWRWKVTEGQSHGPRYFRSLSLLLAYVSERTGAPPPS